MARLKSSQYHRKNQHMLSMRLIQYYVLYKCSPKRLPVRHGATRVAMSQKPVALATLRC